MASTATITTGSLAALWIHLQPPFTADVTLSGAVRFQRSSWEHMEKELQTSRIPVVPSTLPIDLRDTHNKASPPPIEIVLLIPADRKDNIEDIVKYRVRRRFSSLNHGEKNVDILQGRLTFGQCIQSIFQNDSSVSFATSRLFKSALSMRPKIVALLLGGSKTSMHKYQMEKKTSTNANLSSVDSKDLLQVSPWEEDGGILGKGVVPVPGNGKKKKNSPPPAPFHLKRNTTAIDLPRNQFLAAYVAIWRVLVGSLIHLDIHPAVQKSNKRNESTNNANNTVPRREVSKRSGNWLGLHPDYRSRAVDQALADFSVFSSERTSISKKEFERWLSSVVELNCKRRTKADALMFLKTIETCWKQMFQASHTVSYRTGFSKLIYEPRAVSAALAMMTNDGYVVTPSATRSTSSLQLDNMTSNSSYNNLTKGLQGTGLSPRSEAAAAGTEPAAKLGEIAQRLLAACLY